MTWPLVKPLAGNSTLSQLDSFSRRSSQTTLSDAVRLRRDVVEQRLGAVGGGRLAVDAVGITVAGPGDHDLAHHLPRVLVSA